MKHFQFLPHISKRALIEEQIENEVIGDVYPFIKRVVTSLIIHCRWTVDAMGWKQLEP